MPSPRLSIITTCKGRLDHLRVTLPAMLAALPHGEVIVVDYDCPQHTAAAVAREFPAARVVKVSHKPGFNPSDARNRGGEAATGEWLVFIDADVVMDRRLFDDLRKAPPRPGTFFRFRIPGAPHYSAAGTCIASKIDFDAIGGYDVALRNYGGDDDDFYARLKLHGCRQETLDGGLIVDVLAHDNRARTEFLPDGSLGEHQRINAAYIIVKNTLLRQMPKNHLSLDKRKQLYGLIENVVRQSFRTARTPVHFTMELPEDGDFMPTVGWSTRRQITFDLTPIMIPTLDEDLESHGT